MKEGFRCNAVENTLRNKVTVDNNEVNNFVLYKFKKYLPCDCCPCLPHAQRKVTRRNVTTESYQVDKVE